MRCIELSDMLNNVLQPNEFTKHKQIQIEFINNALFFIIINGITLQTRVDDALTALLIVLENQQEID